MNKFIATFLCVSILSTQAFATGDQVDNRNYPLVAMIIAAATGAPGIVITMVSRIWGVDSDKPNPNPDTSSSVSNNDIGTETRNSTSKTYNFKDVQWEIAFYTGLSLDGLGVLSFFLAIAMACLQIGYTPIERSGERHSLVGA